MKKNLMNWLKSFTRNIFKELKMKKTILTALIVLFSITLATTEIKEGKFEVTYSITFNSISLKKASELEKKICELFLDACELNMSIKQKSNIIEIGQYWMPDVKPWNNINPSYSDILVFE